VLNIKITFGLFLYSTSAMSLLYECINTVIAGKYTFIKFTFFLHDKYYVNKNKLFETTRYEYKWVFTVYYSVLITFFIS